VVITTHARTHARTWHKRALKGRYVSGGETAGGPSPSAFVFVVVVLFCPQTQRAKILFV